MPGTWRRTIVYIRREEMMGRLSITRHLECLRCPASGGSLRYEALGAGGVLRAAGFDWPVVEGIAVFDEGPESRRALELLERGDQRAAGSVLAAKSLRSRSDRIQSRLEHWLLRRPAAEGPAARRCRARLASLPEKAFPEAAHTLFGQHPWPVPETATYFIDRRSDPSFVAAEAIALTLLGGRSKVLDLGCGVGHMISSLAVAPYPPEILAGVDALFPALLLARQYLAPNALLVCADADRLPFREGVFDGLVSVDAFFDFSSLPAAAREMRRVLGKEGTLLLPHLHNRLVEHIYSGRCPLSPEQYLEVLSEHDPRLLDERDLLAAATGLTDEPLIPRSEPESLVDAADLVLVGGRAPESITIDCDRFPAPVGRWQVNPLYRREEGSPDLRRSAARYMSEQESGPVPGLLPEQASASPEFDSGLGRDRPSGARDLIRSRVLIPLPAGYDAAVVDSSKPSAAGPLPRAHRTGPLRWARELRSRMRSPGLVRSVKDAARSKLPGGGLVILMGHRLSAARGPDPLDLVLPARQLGRLLDAAASVGEILAFDKAIEALRADALPGGLSFALTFDDGTEDLLEYGPAVLSRRGVRAAVFVTGPQAAPEGRYHWDREGGGGLRAEPSALGALDSVFLLGHHTQTHRALERLPDEQIRAELAPLDQATGPWIAYPFGQADDAGARAAAVARQLGFLAGLTTRRGISTTDSDPMLLPRLPLHDVPPDSLLRNLQRELEALP